MKKYHVCNVVNSMVPKVLSKGIYGHNILLMMRRNTDAVHVVKALIIMQAFKITKMYILEKNLTNANSVQNAFQKVEV